MTEKTLKCYGMYIDVSEVQQKTPLGVMDELLESQKVVGVYQDSGGQRQVLIYNEKSRMKAAVKKAKALGFETVKMCPTMIYVPEKDVQEKEFLEVKNESSDCC